MPKLPSFVMTYLNDYIRGRVLYDKDGGKILDAEETEELVDEISKYVKATEPRVGHVRYSIPRRG